MTSSTSTPPSPSLLTTSSTMNADKLSGQLIIKAQLGNDIRKMMIHNEDLTLNELVLMMERIFTGKIANSDEITIKYLDDDGDHITLLNDSDLTVALHFHKLLRLFVCVRGDEQTNTNATSSADKQGTFVDAKTFRRELQEIRNSVQTILDRLQLSADEGASTATSSSAAPVHELDSFKQSQQLSTAPDTSQSTPYHGTQNEHRTINAQQVESTDMNKSSSTSHFIPSGFSNEQQARTNVFGPPPSAFSSVPPLSNTAIPRFPPATAPNSNAPPMINSTNSPPTSSVGQPSPFMNQQTAIPPPQSSGYYGQQQNTFQQRPQYADYNTNNAYPPQQPAPNNPAFTQAPPPPPMASQQPYGAYPPQNSYYNPVQQYPNA